MSDDMSSTSSYSHVRVAEVVHAVLAAPIQAGPPAPPQPPTASGLQQRQLPPQLRVSDELLAALLSLGSRGVSTLLKEVARAGDKGGQGSGMVRAAALFSTLRAAPKGSPARNLCDAYTYTAMVTLCTMQQEPRRALDSAFGLVEDMRVVGVAANVHTYTALMNVCIKSREYERALQVFDMMRRARVAPNVVTWNTLVDVYGKLGNANMACSVLDMMRAEGVPPAQRTYNTVIIACNSCGQPQQALQVYLRMISDNLPPNSTTCNALISAYGKTRNLPSALAVYRDMVAGGMERSVITYSSLISACEKAGDWQMALQVFADMRADGCAPNTITFNSLITACAQAAQWERARGVYEQMVVAGCSPDVVTYTSLIAAYARGGEWQAALVAFADMCAAGCAPDAIVYNAIIDALWETGVVWAQSAAMHLFKAAQQQGLFQQRPLLPPNERTSSATTSTSGAGQAAAQQAAGSQSQRSSSMPNIPAAPPASTSGGPEGGGAGSTSGGRQLGPSASAGSRPHRHELDLHAMTAGVAMLSLATWLSELRQVMMRGRSGELLPRIAIVVDAGRASREAGNAVVRDAVTAMCAFYESPFRTASDPMYACVLEAATPEVATWVTNHGLDALLVSAFPVFPITPAAQAAGGQQQQMQAQAQQQTQTQGAAAPGLQLPGMGGMQSAAWRPALLQQLQAGKWAGQPLDAALGAATSTAAMRPPLARAGRSGGRASMGAGSAAATANASAAAMAAVSLTAPREAAVGPLCEAAYAGVEAFEGAHSLVLANMRQPYLAARSALISHMLDLTSQLGMTDEVVHDAVQLLDRAACEAQLLSEDHTAMAEAVLRISVSQAQAAGSGGDQPQPTLADLDSVLSLPAARITAAEWEVRRVLRGDCAASSTMRAVKLYLERMGYRGLGAPGVYGLGGYAIMLAVEGLYDTGLLNTRPSLVAAALLWSERRLRGVVPFWPSVLARMTHTPDISANAELASATRLAQALARKPVYAHIYRTQLTAMCAPGAARQGGLTGPLTMGSPGAQAAAIAASGRGHAHTSIARALPMAAAAGVASISRVSAGGGGGSTSRAPPGLTLPPTPGNPDIGEGEGGSASASEQGPAPTQVAEVAVQAGSSLPSPTGSAASYHSATGGSTHG